MRAADALCITGIGLHEGQLEAGRRASADGRHYYDAAREIVDCVSMAAARAARMAEIPPALRQGAETWLATFYGTGHVGEYYAAQLRTASAHALNPRAFSLFCLNAASSSASSSLGLTGGAFTLAGLGAHQAALSAARRSLQVHRHELTLYGAFDWPSPLVANELARRGFAVTPWQGAAAVVVIESALSAESRGATVVGEAGSLVDIGGRGDGRLVPGVAEVTAVVKELLHPRSAGVDPATPLAQAAP